MHLGKPSLAMGLQRGYVLSLMFLLALTIVGIGLFVGFHAVRDAWFKQHEFKRSVDVYVLHDQDGNPGGPATVLGKAVDFDEHETPLIPFIDYGQTYNGKTVNYRTLIGVRDDRFTTPDRVYYHSNNCTTSNDGNGDNDACVFVPSFENHPFRYGLSYQQATQAGASIAANDSQKTYAVGRTESEADGLPGWLWRQTDEDCVVSDANDINSSWNSKSLDPNPINSCEAENFVVQLNLGQEIECGNSISTCDIDQYRNPGPAVVTYPMNCAWTGLQTGNLNGNTGAAIGFAGGVGATYVFDAHGPGGTDTLTSCDCPPGWFDTGGGGPGAKFCCPPGTTNVSAGQCQQIAANIPANGTFKKVEMVELPANQNIFDNFILFRPFTINTPINVDTDIINGENIFDKSSEANPP